MGWSFFASQTGKVWDGETIYHAECLFQLICSSILAGALIEYELAFKTRCLENLYMISLKQINYALAVDKTRHFKKAADMCFVSQSALSTAISELEKQLDIQIFERDNKKVLVTPLGEQFLQKAAQVKIDVDDLYHISQSHKGLLNYPFSFGVIPTIGPYLLPKVLPALRKQYPDSQLKIIEEQSHVLVDMVRSGELDAAVLALPYPIEGLLAFEFWDEDFYWIAHKSEKFADQKEITSGEINHGRLMLLKDGHCLKDHALAVCKMQNNEVENDFASTSLNTLIQMAAGKMGTTLVPEMALDQLLHDSSELTAVHLNEPGPHRKLAFIIRPNYTGMANVDLLKDIFIKELKRIYKK